MSRRGGFPRDLVNVAKVRARLQSDLKDNHVDSILSSFKSHLNEVDTVLKKMDKENASMKRNTRMTPCDLDSLLSPNIGAPRPPVKPKPATAFRRGSLNAPPTAKSDPPPAMSDPPNAKGGDIKVPSPSEPLRPLRKKNSSLRHSSPSMHSTSKPLSADEDPPLEPIRTSRRAASGRRSAYSDVNPNGFRKNRSSKSNSNSSNSDSKSRPGSTRENTAGNKKGVRLDPRAHNWWETAHQQDSIKYQKAREAEHEELEANFQRRQVEMREERRREEERRRAETEEARQLYEERRQFTEKKRREERDANRKAQDHTAHKKLEGDRFKKRAQFEDFCRKANEWKHSDERETNQSSFLGGMWQERRVLALEKAHEEWDQKWEAFYSRVKSSQEEVLFDDIPWVPDSMRVSWITEADDDAACKRKLHNAMRRWHPDKFLALFGGALQGGDKERVLEAVTQTAARLFKEMEELRQKGK